MDPELISELNEQLRQLTATMGATMTAMTGSEASYKKIPGSVGGFVDSLTRGGKASDEHSGALGSLKRSNDMAAASAVALGKGLDASAGAISSFAKAVNEGGGSFKKYNDSLSKAGDAALEFGMALGGPLAIGIGLVVKALTSLIGAVNAQQDALLSASDSISQMGAAGSFSTTSLQEIAHQVGLTSTDLDKLTKPMQSMHGGLQTLGGTMEDSVKNFASMNNVSKETRQAFQRLGFDDEKRIQATADYIQLQRSSGAMLSKDQLTSAALQAGSQAYTENLVKLSAITGKSIEENKKEQEIARANVAWKIQEHKWATDRQAALARGDDAAVKRIDMQRAAANKMMDDAQAAGGPAMAAAAATTYLTGAVTKAGAGYAVAGLDIRKMADAAKDGSYKQGQLLDAYDKGMGHLMDRAGAAVALSDPLQQNIGLNEKYMGDSNTRQAQAMNGMNRVQAFQDEAEKLAKNEAGKGPVGEDKQQKNRNELTESERKLKLSSDGLLEKFNGLTTVVTKLTSAIAFLFPGDHKPKPATAGGGGPGRGFGGGGGHDGSVPQGRAASGGAGAAMKSGDLSSIFTIGKPKPAYLGVMQTANKSGDPHPEITAAQWALESGWGKHMSGKNNPFGQKARKDKAGNPLEPATLRRTREVYNGKEVYINDYFKDFSSQDQAISEHVQKWTARKTTPGSSPIDAAAALKAAGYATDPNYVKLLANIVASNGIDPKMPLRAKNGGMFDGPTSGYPVELHGREMIAPLNADSILMKLAKTPANAPENKGMLDHATNSTQHPVDNSMKQVMGLHQDTMKMLSHKLDSVIHVLENTHSTQNKILRQSMV